VDIPFVEVAFAESGNARVIGPPRWWRAIHGPDSFALYFALSPTALQRLHGQGSGLDPQTERFMLALHEAGHATIANGLGLECVELRVNPDQAKAFKDRPALASYASTDMELPTTGPTVAAVSLAGWLAAEAYLTLLNGGMRPPADAAGLAWVQFGAADDHDFILARLTKQPTAYLYGDVLPPAAWDGQVVVMDDVARKVGGSLTSDTQRWQRMLKIAEHAVQAGTVAKDTLMQILEPPGWAIDAFE
jgi:hypothetical protein